MICYLLRLASSRRSPPPTNLRSPLHSYGKGLPARATHGNCNQACAPQTHLGRWCHTLNGGNLGARFSLPFGCVLTHLPPLSFDRSKSSQTRTSTYPPNRNFAQFRCDEIAKVALDVVNEEVRSVRRPVEAGNLVEGLGGLMTGWKETALG
jgi:hypothetical protein